MTTVQLPNGRDITIKDKTAIVIYNVVTRQLILPTGTRVHVPVEHEWVILSMSVLPHYQYTPPGGKRDPYAFGDVRLNIEEQDSKHFRANALSLMDRYWGRYNLSPELPEAIMKLEQAQHAVQTAPSIPELGAAIEHALDTTKHYLHAAAPDFPKPIMVKGGQTITPEQVTCQAGDHIPPTKFAGLDVELLLIIKRPTKRA